MGGGGGQDLKNKDFATLDGDIDTRHWFVVIGDCAGYDIYYDYTIRLMIPYLLCTRVVVWSKSSTVITSWTDINYKQEKSIVAK